MGEAYSKHGKLPRCCRYMSCSKRTEVIEESWSARILEISKVETISQYDRLESVIESF